jgi:large subunit ribosomal protein L17
MRHRKSGRKLGRNSSHRKAMFRNMVTSLILEEQIKTTEAKAKEVRSICDKVISLGKRVPLSSRENLSGDDLATAKAQRVHAIRLARKWVVDRTALEKLFGEYSERYQGRPGGYTRILKLGRRNGDNAPMNLVQLVSSAEKALKPAPEEESGASE